MASRWLRRRPVARLISRSFSFRSWLVGAFVAAAVGAALYWITPFKAGQALVVAFVAAACGMLGEFVMKALKRDAGVHQWGNRAGVTGAVGLLTQLSDELKDKADMFRQAAKEYAATDESIEQALRRGEQR